MAYDDFIRSLIGDKPNNPGRSSANFSVVRNGLRYRAVSMDEVATYKFGRLDDFEWVMEILHRSEKGAFLLVAEGGPSSPWRARDDDGFRNGHAYIPLTPDQAQRWLELRGLDEDLDALFGEGLEDA
ncbi:hypothetical protein [Azospirillum ramasamyi]|nr:hypothetical protein [Azospirillum ramasamyi]